MKLLESQLRRIIRRTISEAWDPFAKTKLKGDPSLYSTGDEPITKYDETMADMVLSVVIRFKSIVKRSLRGEDQPIEDTAEEVYTTTHLDYRKRLLSGYQSLTTEIAEHALDELGLSEYKR